MLLLSAHLFETGIGHENLAILDSTSPIGPKLSLLEEIALIEVPGSNSVATFQLTYLKHGIGHENLL